MPNAQEHMRSSYLRDDAICADLGVSAMTLTRMRQRGLYPRPVQFTPGGPNHTPREEHENFKAEREAASREIRPEKRAAGQRLVVERKKWLERQAGKNPGGDPQPRPARRGKAGAGTAPVVPSEGERQ